MVDRIAADHRPQWAAQRPAQSFSNVMYITRAREVNWRTANCSVGRPRPSKDVPRTTQTLPNVPLIELAHAIDGQPHARLSFAGGTSLGGTPRSWCTRITVSRRLRPRPTYRESSSAGIAQRNPKSSQRTRGEVPCRTVQRPRIHRRTRLHHAEHAPSRKQALSGFRKGNRRSSRHRTSRLSIPKRSPPCPALRMDWLRWGSRKRC